MMMMMMIMVIIDATACCMMITAHTDDDDGGDADRYHDHAMMTIMYTMLMVIDANDAYTCT